jgi:DNA replication protein DnaC
MKRTLPEKFVEGFKVTGSGWNEAEMGLALSMRTAVQEMAAAIRARDPGWSILFTGQTSVGKTMLAKALLNYARNVELCEPVNYTGEPPPGPCMIYWPKHTWEEVRDKEDATFLFIDEAGRAERAKSEQQRIEAQRFMDLINFRLERRLFTVVTSNMTFAEIEAGGPALASRFRRNNGRVFQTLPAVRPFEKRR